jgi:hypothetical protein
MLPGLLPVGSSGLFVCEQWRSMASRLANCGVDFKIL